MKFFKIQVINWSQIKIITTSILQNKESKMIRKLFLIAILLHVCLSMEDSTEFLKKPNKLRQAPVCNEKDVASPTSCSWYSTCLQRTFKCPLDSYPLGYGLKYCSRFTSMRNEFPPMARDWISKTLVCLKKSLVPFAASPTKGTTKAKCDQLTDAAFQSHSYCYVQNGFCQLFTEQSMSDMTQTCKALRKVYDLGDLFQSRSLGQIVETVKGCGFIAPWTYGKIVFACGMSLPF